MTAWTVVSFVLGLVCLVLGADWFVRGASKLAVAIGISPLVVGLTVVAFGTSSPELAVSMGAAFRGQADMAVGNVIGSNIFNVLFILGAAAMITPLVVAQDLVRRDVPLMILASVVVWLLARDGSIGRIDGAVLVLALTAYTVWVVRASRKEQAQAEFVTEFGRADPPERVSHAACLGLIVVGLALLMLGSNWLVGSAIDVAKWLGISEVVVSLTIVAAGTSLPEVATSVLAAIRGERDIAVGNVVGSNVFNLLGVLGVAAVVGPDGLPVQASMVSLDLPLMIAVALACMPIYSPGRMIPRWQGALFFAYYVAYTAFLVLDSTQHEATADYVAVMLRFALPLTVLTLVVMAVRARRSWQRGQ